MMRTILNAWTIFAGLAAVGLGGWICVGTPIAGVAIMLLGFLVLGLGVSLIREGVVHHVVARPVPTLAFVPAVPRSNRRDVQPRLRSVA